MAATVDIVERNGSTGTATTKTSGTVRFKNADDAAVDSNDPLVIPGAGADWSYEKWLRLQIGGTGPSDKIDNVQFYTNGDSYGAASNVSVWARSSSGFSTPAELTTSTGLTNAFSYTSGASLDLNSVTSPVSGTSTYVGSHVVLSMEVSLSATVGALTGKTITFSYDEI